ncbi:MULTISPECIES: hypothetical protein [Microbacterium]|uniref:Uncharacterized protein n=1 Tax=Microbacterium wangchenii TaxID=2541726 RepID=A0ABX5SV46_9MICO|nr:MULTISPECIES: hypothetical protein [Microbacterium]MCK6065719.1 hypothetical protein [Microbacterium sp. EYE_512]QBR89125.1 hypothetical protein E4K62_10780 [Microbacterium wangchenii]TXK20845.1 hypothetical protein FVP99_04395 [Microbacterium wangchenii]
MTIGLRIGGTTFPLDRSVFTTLLDNSVAGTYKDYETALETGAIKLAKLQYLAEKGDIPLPLFFAPLPLVQAQVEAKTQKLLAGVSRDTFSIGSRASVQLRDVELIVKDLIRKQQLLRAVDDSLARNTIVGMLSRLGPSPEDDAAKLRSAIGLSQDDLRACRKKETALELIIDRLEDNQVLVSRSVNNYMPQRLTHADARFSGMTVRDNKVPFIFLAGGDHGDRQEPVGRTIFTLTLMTVLVARRIFAPMTWDGGSAETDPGVEYDIAGAILMPADQLSVLPLSSLDEVKQASDVFKVTPSAVTVRAMRLGIVSGDIGQAHLAELRREFDGRTSGGPRSPILPENAVKKYGGRELSRRMLAALDTSKITRGEFCRAVCLNRLKPHQINDLRRVIG